MLIGQPSRLRARAPMNITRPPCGGSISGTVLSARVVSTVPFAFWWMTISSGPASGSPAKQPESGPSSSPGQPEKKIAERERTPNARNLHAGDVGAFDARVIIQEHV